MEIHGKCCRLIWEWSLPLQRYLKNLSTLAWKIPWTEEPSGLQSMGSWRVRHDLVTLLSLFTFKHWRRIRQPTPVFLPEESQGWRAWWAAVCGVAQSRTRLKRLSNSSSSKLCPGFSINFCSSSCHLQTLIKFMGTWLFCLLSDIGMLMEVAHMWAIQGR